MSHQTFLITCAILIGLPFVVSCFAGKGHIGMLTGLIGFLSMGFLAGQGSSMLVILVTGFIIAGIGISLSLNRD